MEKLMDTLHKEKEMIYYYDKSTGHSGMGKITDEFTKDTAINVSAIYDNKLPFFIFTQNDSIFRSIDDRNLYRDEFEKKLLECN